MHPDTELSEIMRSIAEKGLRLLANYKEPDQSSQLTEKFLEVSRDFQALLTTLLKNPDKLWQTQIAHWQDAVHLLHGQLKHWQEGKAMPIADKRFSSEEWVNNPFFNLLSQQYLLASEHLNRLLSQIEYDDAQLAKRMKFFMRQYLDALSPDNFLQTNPQLMIETLQSQGKNLLKGLQNLLADLEDGSARLVMKMTDTAAFKVGKNIAITPGKVIYKNDLMELIQYSPQTTQVYSVPLLIIPPWINKYYILDLRPENSMIRWLVTQGITVFVISWVNPNASYANKSLNDYLNEGPLTAIKIIQEQLQIKQVNALGFCIGGTLLAAVVAYQKAIGDQSVRSATFLAAMIDFSDPGDMAVFIDEQQISNLEERMNAKGYLEGHVMASAFNSLRASDLIWSFFIKNYLRGQAPVPFDILYWNGDATNMPANMHSQYLRWMYLQNDLMKADKITFNNVPINVANIDIPTFFVSTKKDHIAPWQTTYSGFQLMNGKKRFLLGGSGHIAGIVIPPGSEKYGFYRNVNAAATAEDWLANADHHPGSWWPEWLEWLKNESGPLIAPPSFERLPFKGLMNAPGQYVHQACKVEVDPLLGLTAQPTVIV